MEDSTVNCSKKSIDPTNTPLLAIAKYEFEGQNNDEVSFQLPRVCINLSRVLAFIPNE
jgi:hypothetical protein